MRNKNHPKYELIHCIKGSKQVVSSNINACVLVRTRHELCIDEHEDVACFNSY